MHIHLRALVLAAAWGLAPPALAQSGDDAFAFDDEDLDDLDDFDLEDRGGAKTPSSSDSDDDLDGGDPLEADEFGEDPHWDTPRSEPGLDDLDGDPSEDFDRHPSEDFGGDPVEDLGEAPRGDDPLDHLSEDDFGDDPVEHFDKPKPKPKPTPTPVTTGKGPRRGLGLKIGDATPLSGAFTPTVLALDMDAVVVELPILLARSASDFDGADYAVQVDITADGRPVQQLRYQVTSTALADLGPTLIWAKVHVPVMETSGSVAFKVSRVTRDAEGTESAAPLFEKSTKYKL